jgi:signal transduction histidine kinase
MKMRDKERRRIGEALHEDVMQVLAGTRIFMESSLVGDPTKQSAALARGADMLQGAIQTLRTIMIDMRPHMLYETGIIGYILWLEHWVRQTYNIIVHVDTDGTVDPASEDIRVFLYEAARELLINVATHARSGQANLDIRRLDPNHLRLSVRDDGVGFDPTQLKYIPSYCFGLFWIQELVELLGGQMELQSAPGGGTHVSLTIPV